MQTAESQRALLVQSSLSPWHCGILSEKLEVPLRLHDETVHNLEPDFPAGVSADS